MKWDTLTQFDKETYMVLRLSNPIMASSLVCPARGKLQQARCSVHTNHGIFRTLTPTEEAKIIDLPIFISWELQQMAPDIFGSCPGHCLEDAGMLLLHQHVKGNSASLERCRPMQALLWPPILCTQSAIPTEGPVARACTQARASNS